MILINANFNNQIVKTCFCCIYENHLFENWVCLKKINNLIGSHQPIKIYILENQLGSHNIMRESKLVLTK